MQHLPCCFSTLALCLGSVVSDREDRASDKDLVLVLFWKLNPRAERVRGKGSQAGEWEASPLRLLLYSELQRGTSCCLAGDNTWSHRTWSSRLVAGRRREEIDLSSFLLPPSGRDGAVSQLPGRPNCVTYVFWQPLGKLGILSRVAFPQIEKRWEKPEAAGMKWFLLKDWLPEPACIHVLHWW